MLLGYLLELEHFPIVISSGDMIITIHESKGEFHHNYPFQVNIKGTVFRSMAFKKMDIEDMLCDSIYRALEAVDKEDEG